MKFVIERKDGLCWTGSMWGPIRYAKQYSESDAAPLLLEWHDKEKKQLIVRDLPDSIEKIEYIETKQSNDSEAIAKAKILE